MRTARARIAAPSSCRHPSSAMLAEATRRRLCRWKGQPLGGQQHRSGRWCERPPCQPVPPAGRLPSQQEPCRAHTRGIDAETAGKRRGVPPPAAAVGRSAGSGYGVARAGPTVSCRLLRPPGVSCGQLTDVAVPARVSFEPAACIRACETKRSRRYARRHLEWKEPGWGGAPFGVGWIWGGPVCRTVPPALSNLSGSFRFGIPTRPWGAAAASHSAYRPKGSASPRDE